MNDKRQQSTTAGAREAALAALATPGPRPSPVCADDVNAIIVRNRSPKLGDNVECHGAARRRRELWCCATCSGGIRIIASCLHDQQGRARAGSIDRQADRQQGGRELGKAERVAGKWVRPDTLNSPLQNEKNLVTHTGNWNRTHTDTRTRTHTHTRTHTEAHTGTLA